MTHEQYLNEPADVIDWAQAFAHMESEMENESMERARTQAPR